MSVNVLNPGFVNTKAREMLEAIAEGRNSTMGFPGPYYKYAVKVGDKVEDRRAPYVVMFASAPLRRGNELLKDMVGAVPVECTHIIWRSNIEIRQENPFRRDPRILVRMRFALLDENGGQLTPTRYVHKDGEPPIELESYDTPGKEGGYVLQPAN